MFTFRGSVGTRLGIGRNVSYTMGDLSISYFSGEMNSLAGGCVQHCGHVIITVAITSIVQTSAHYACIMHVVDNLQLIFNSVNGHSTQVAKTHCRVSNFVYTCLQRDVVQRLLFHTHVHVPGF